MSREISTMRVEQLLNLTSGRLLRKHNGHLFLFPLFYQIDLNARTGSFFTDLLFSADDPDDTGRPVRIRFGPQPKDGDALVLQELGGFPETTNTA